VVTQCALKTYNKDRGVGDGTSDDEINNGKDEDDSEIDN